LTNYELDSLIYEVNELSFVCVFFGLSTMVLSLYKIKINNI